MPSVNAAWKAGRQKQVEIQKEFEKHVLLALEGCGAAVKLGGMLSYCCSGPQIDHRRLQLSSALLRSVWAGMAWRCLPFS